MTLRKAGYIKGIADAAISGEVNFHTLHTLSDNEVIERLTSLNGVGVWTAEMVLIFSLCRPDVVSYEDLAIRRGMMKLYGLRSLGKKNFIDIKEILTLWFCSLIISVGTFCAITLF